jgi:hypothetical protein
LKKNHFRSFAILFGLLVCGAACYGLLHLWQQPVEDAWTPSAYAPPFVDVADRVQLYVGGEPLTKVLEKQQLVLKKDGAEAPFTAQQLVATVNNHDRLMLGRIPVMLGLAAVAGAALVLFLVGLCAPLISALKPPPIVDLHLEA